MICYIPCYGTNILLSIGNLRASRKLLLQVGLLIFAQPLRYHLEVSINYPLVYRLVGISPLVYQWQHRLVLYCLPHCILVYHIAKLVQCAPIFHKQGRTRKGNETSIRHGFLHIYVECAMLCAMPLIYQHKYIIAHQPLLNFIDSRFKFINNGSYHRIGIALEYLYQVTAR